MIPVALAALASMLFGTGDFLGGLASRRSPALAVTLVALVAGFALLVPAAMRDAGIAGSSDYAWSVAGGVLGGLGVALLFHLLAVGPVGTVAPVVAVCGVAVPALAGLAFGERPGAIAIAGIVLAAVAVALVSLAAEPVGDSVTRNRSRAAKGTVLLSMVSGFGLGAFLVCLSRVPMSAGLWPLVVARLAGTLSVATALAFQARPGARLVPERSAIALAGVSGLIDSVANLLYLWVVRQHPVSIVGTIVSLSPATVVLLARVVLRERFHRAQVTGLVLAAVAIVLMTWTRG